MCEVPPTGAHDAPYAHGGALAVIVPLEPSPKFTVYVPVVGSPDAFSDTVSGAEPELGVAVKLMLCEEFDAIVIVTLAIELPLGLIRVAV